MKRGLAEPDHVEESVRQKCSPEPARGGGNAARRRHGCTDVTGFGLIGHRAEMALASGVTLESNGSGAVSAGAVSMRAGAPFPAAIKNNREFAPCVVEAMRELPREIEDLLYEPANFRRPADLAGRSDARASNSARRRLPYRPVLDRGEKAIRLI